MRKNHILVASVKKMFALKYYLTKHKKKFHLLIDFVTKIYVFGGGVIPLT